MVRCVSDVTRILSQIEQGDPQAAEKLLPLVYDELRKLAAARLAHEKPGQTLQATALVHEAYLRLAGGEQAQSWKHRGHFFAAAAEAIRRILVESARRKKSLKHGGEAVRAEAAVGLVEAGEDFDEGRLAGAILAQQGMHLSGHHFELHVLQRTHASKRFGNVLHLNNRLFIAHHRTLRLHRCLAKLHNLLGWAW